MNTLTTEAAPLDTIRSLVTCHAKITTGTSGAISTSRLHGLTVTKAARLPGRYTVQAVDSKNGAVALRLLETVHVAIWSPTADNAITAGAGICWCLRNVNETAGTFDVQFFAPTQGVSALTNVDAELENGAVFTVQVQSVRNQVTP